MVFMKCHIRDCNESFTSIDAIQLHFSIQHPTCKYFRCVIEECGRSFTAWNSFWKHLRNKHNVPKHFTECNNEMQPSHPSPSHNNSNVTVNTNCVSETKLCDRISPSDFHTLLEEHINILISKMNTKWGLPRNQVDSVIEDISIFLGVIFVKILKEKVIDTLSKCNADVQDICSIEAMFKSLSNPFNHLSSEYKRMKYFKSTGAYIPPESYCIDSRVEKISTQQEVKLQMTQVTAQHIPLRLVLQKFFELPDVFNSTVQYMQELQATSDTIYNFVQCERWKCVTTKYFKKSDIVFPLLIYYDDWEPNNPLGPHLHKIGSVYVAIPCLPPECQSKLDNMFLALLFYSDDRKQYGNRKTFVPLITELTFLESKGIDINMTEKKQRIYFATGLLIGDNLGIHSMCGFVESFSANFMCRFCKASKFMTEMQCVEDPTLFRTSKNYYSDLAIQNVSLTGIKEECTFNSISSIDIAEMPFVDGMHDCLEGVGHYSMIPILKHLSRLDPLFLETLNYRMNLFHYGPYDNLNKPPCITFDTLNKNKLKMTANEMNVFVRLFGIFIGDMVDEKDQFWQLYLMLHEIFSIIMAKKLPSDIGHVIQILIKDHNELYIKNNWRKIETKTSFPHTLC